MSATTRKTRDLRPGDRVVNSDGLLPSPAAVVAFVRSRRPDFPNSSTVAFEGAIFGQDVSDDHEWTLLGPETTEERVERAIETATSGHGRATAADAEVLACEVLRLRQAAGGAA